MLIYQQIKNTFWTYIWTLPIPVTNKIYLENASLCYRLSKVSRYHCFEDETLFCESSSFIITAHWFGQKGQKFSITDVFCLYFFSLEKLRSIQIDRDTQFNNRVRHTQAPFNNDIQFSMEEICVPLLNKERFRKSSRSGSTSDLVNVTFVYLRDVFV